MRQAAQFLVVGSAATILLLGLIHLRYTFWGRMLCPRDASLEIALRQVSPVITRETTMWNAWVGFNASHAFGAILFGTVYGYLAIAHAGLLFESPLLPLVGLLLLVGYVVLGKLYWFSVPFRSIVAAAILYAVGLVLGWA